MQREGGLAQRDFEGQGPHTWYREIQTESRCPKANKKHLKMFSELKSLALPTVWTGSHQVGDQPNFFHLEVKDRE